MSTEPSKLVRQAIILAAGNGDRFHSGTRHSKLLTTIGGTPLLHRTLIAARQAGITDAHLVLGYDADRVRASAMASPPARLRLHFHLNKKWQHENGLSVLTARPWMDGRPFALLMGDHLFDPRVLGRLLRLRRRPDETLLGIDRQRHDRATVREATKVRLQRGRVTAIGKRLTAYDGLDTGLFVSQASLFDALDQSCADGDTTLSGGIRRLAARGLVRGVDILRARWCDIDTLDDLALAEQLVGDTARTAGQPSRP